MIQKPPESWDTRTLHNIDKDLGRIALKEDLAEERMGISEPLEVASATLSFYAVDKVYGLLGVMPLPVADNIVVDCRLNEARLFEATARLFINYEGCNEVLRSGTLWNSKNIASWAPDWTREHGRRDMLKPQRPYEADKGTTPVISFSPDGRLLTVRGVILDEVDGLGGVVDLDEGLPTTFEKVESGIKRHLRHPEHFTARTYRNAAAMRLALHRTLVGARSGKFGQDLQEGDPISGIRRTLLFSLPSSFNDAMAIFEERALKEGPVKEPGWAQFTVQGSRYKEWARWRESNDGLLVTDISGLKVPLSSVIEAEELPPDEDSLTIFHEFFIFRHMLMGRRLVTTKQGRFGWVPERGEGDQSVDVEDRHVKEGDLFVLVFGCRVPLVVRPCGDKFQIFGEGYLDGLMDGEALERIESGIFVVRTLTFC